MPDVIPMLAYENGVTAMEWLARAFGFRERTRWLGPNGQLTHGEMETGDGLIMLATPTPYYESPGHHRQVCERAKRWDQAPWVINGVLVYVDNVDAHYQRAKLAGATILSEPEDGPPRADIASKILKAIVGCSWNARQGNAGWQIMNLVFQNPTSKR